MTPPRNALVRMYGHSLATDGAIDWQFLITDQIDADHYLIVLHSWIDGTPTTYRVVSLDWLMACRLYHESISWREAGDRQTAAQGLRVDG